MAMIRSYNDFLTRIGGGFTLNEPVWDECQTVATSVFSSGQIFTLQHDGYCKALPSLPAGVTAYIATSMSFSCFKTQVSITVCKLINLGSLDISVPTFTDGAAMPTVTELGVSRQVDSPIIVEVTTALNATPGNLAITYVDDAGSAAEAGPTIGLTASAAIQSCGIYVLNSADRGVRDVTSATRTGGTTPTGVLKFWGIIPLAFMVSGTSGVCSANVLTETFNPVRLGANDQIGCFLNTSNSRSLFGNIFFVGDS